MANPESVLKLGQALSQNTTLHLRERAWAGGQYKAEITIPTGAVPVDILLKVDLFGAALKTFTVINRDAALALGVGSVLVSGPHPDFVTESKSTADFDSLAAQGVASVSIAGDASRFWSLTVVGNAGGPIKLDIYVDANIHG